MHVNGMVFGANYQQEVQTNRCYEDETEDYYKILEKQSEEEDLFFLSGLFDIQLD